MGLTMLLLRSSVLSVIIETRWGVLPAGDGGTSLYTHDTRDLSELVYLTEYLDFPVAGLLQVVQHVG